MSEKIDEKPDDVNYLSDDFDIDKEQVVEEVND